MPVLVQVYKWVLVFVLPAVVGIHSWEQLVQAASLALEVSIQFWEYKF